jgi:hypothetical protein
MYHVTEGPHNKSTDLKALNTEGNEYQSDAEYGSDKVEAECRDQSTEKKPNNVTENSHKNFLFFLFC